jgi:FAS-associated factor 2
MAEADRADAADAVQEFMTITGSSALDARGMLEATASLGEAVNLYYASEQREATDNSAAGSTPEPLPATQREEVRDVGAAAQGAASLPIRAIGAVVRTLLWPLRLLASDEEQPVHGQAAAQRFVQTYERDFGTQHPDFFANSFKQAAARARSESKFLVVYLHSPVHEDTPRFCRQTLSSENLTGFMNQNIVLWGGSTLHADAYIISDRLKATSYPFLGVLICNQSSEDIVCRLQGMMDQDFVLDQLTFTMARHQNQLERLRQQQRARHEAQQLRMEQDQEFQEALEADRRREAEAREVELRQQREESEAQAQEELAAAMELSKSLERESTLKRKRDGLKPEPPAGPDTTRLRLQLPNGSKIDRRFLATQTVEEIRDFIDVYFGDNDISIETYSLATNYPKRTYDDPSICLTEAGLHPQAVLYVHDLDA